MKRPIKKTQKITKGAPSGVIISLVVHAAAFLLAGLLVVFEVFDKPEAKFVPPPKIERPKMDLKKPQVKVKKNIKPRSTRRIVAKNVQVMADVQLPEMSSGIGGLTGGIGGFDMMPAPEEMSMYGSTKSIAVGNDFEGTFYSLALDRRMRETHIDRGTCYDLAKRFCEANWNPRILAPYFRSPEKLYTTHFILPTDITTVGPDAFGFDDPNFPPGMWMIHYKGRISSKKDGRFRFWGAGDDMLIVRINGKIVLDASWSDMRGYASGFEPSDGEHDLGYNLGNTSAKVGHWFEMKAGETIVMEVLMYNNANMTNHILLIEDAEEEYNENRDGMPILPAFKTADFPPALRAEMEYMTVNNEVDFYSDLMFNVH